MTLLSDNFTSVGSGASELRSRISTYRTRLETDNKPAAPQPPKVEDDAKSLILPPVDDNFKPTEIVRQLMHLDSAAMEERLAFVRSLCTIDAAVVDLKVTNHAINSDIQVLLQRLSTDKPLPYGPSDFETEAEWSEYRAKEISTLSDLTVKIMGLDTSRTRGGDKPDQVDLVQSLEGLKMEDRALTYVPPDPREAYRHILRIALDHDLEILRTLPEDQDVSLGILSAEHVALLAECALRWRIPKSYSSWVFLEAIQDHYEKGEVPPDCVFEATGEIGRVSREVPVSSWSILDQQGLQSVIVRRNIFFLNDIEMALNSTGGYLSEEFIQAVEHWAQLGGEEDDHPSFQRTQRAICDRLRQQAYAHYIDEASERYSHEGGKSRQFALALATWIEKGGKRVDKLFPNPITS